MRPLLEPLLGKKYPAPFWTPMGPFLVAGAIVFYGVNAFQNKLANSDEWRNDPRNPYRNENQKAPEKH